MSKSAPITIVNVGYQSTNYWVIGAGRSRLLLDLGYPGTLGTLLANLKRMDIPLHEIRYGLATHYHIDHAGVAQELKQLGMPLLVLERQVAAVPVMKKWTKPHDGYVDITTHDTIVISFEESRRRLAEIGLAGEIISTPEHSDDSVSLLLDDGAVFTGDLPFWPMSEHDDAERVTARWPGQSHLNGFVGKHTWIACTDCARVDLAHSQATIMRFRWGYIVPKRPHAIALARWRRLWEQGARRIYPGHGSIRVLDADGGTAEA